MQIGIDSFAAATTASKSKKSDAGSSAISDLIERIEQAEKMELDIFGVGEHHREEFFDAAPHLILAAAAARTKRIRLTSAVTVLSADDPVRVFQNYATLDLISQGRAEIVAGRGSFSEAFPLFGYDFSDYDELFEEKLRLLLKIRDHKNVTWSGKFRAPLLNQYVYPRPLQKQLPIWVGVGGTPESFIRAGRLGLPLMVAIIGGQPARFRPLIDAYYEAGIQAGHSKDQLKVGMHALGYVAENTQIALDEFFPGHAESFTQIGKERGWPPVTRAHFDAQAGPDGAFLIGSPEEVAEKIMRHSKALGGLSRVTFQMDTAKLPQDKLLKSIELIGQKVKPLVNSIP